MNADPLVAEIIGPDLLIILVIVALLFGSSRLPKLARSLGSAKAEFEKGIAEGASSAAWAPASAAEETVTLTRAELDAIIAQREAVARGSSGPPAPVRPTTAPPGSRRPRTIMNHDHIRDRLHQAMHRAPKASEEELAEVTAVVLAVVGEVTAELALVIAELSARVEALEKAAGPARD